jgi:tetratricopeptide (TPR) repeat protein
LEEGKRAMVDGNTSGIRRFKGRQAKLYKKILIEIEREIQIHPNFADLHNQLGFLLIMEGEPEEAENHFLKALSLNPKYREAVLNLGFLYIEMKRWKEAESIFLSEIKKHPKDGLIHHTLGVLYLQMGRKKEALAQIRKAIQHYSYYQDYYKKKEIWYREAVHLDRRREREFKKVHLNHHYAQFHNFIGLYLAKKGKSTQAIREFKKAARLKPNEFLFHANLGMVHYYRGTYRNAIKEYQHALKINPFYGMGYANLSYTYGLLNRTREALLYSDRRRYEKAISELRKAFRINPNYLFARINLGVLYEDQKKWGEARREYRKILKITPDNEDVRWRLERIS